MSDLNTGAGISPGECKSRGAAFCNLYKWLQGYDFLAIKRDREEPLIIIEARKLASILSQIPAKPNGESKDAPIQDPSQIPLAQQASTIDNPTESTDQPVKIVQWGKPAVAVNLPEPLRGDAQPVSREAQARYAVVGALQDSSSQASTIRSEPMGTRG